MMSFLEFYREKAAYTDINALNGRIGNPGLTAFIAERIASAMKPQPGETVVDIGCGDATALRLMAAREPSANYIGVLPTREEVLRVRAHLEAHGVQDKIKIIESLAECLSVPPLFADRIVCNGVLPWVPEFEKSLSEISRIAKVGARIFIGEMPNCNEALANLANLARHAEERAKVPRLRRIFERLRNDGLVAFWHWFKYMAGMNVPTGSPSLPHPTGRSLSPEEFLEIANRHGMTAIKYSPSLMIDASGAEYTSPIRVDYILSTGNK